MLSLNLNPDNCPDELTAQKVLLDQEGYTVFAILEIAMIQEYEITYNCYVLIREDETGDIQSLYSEKDVFILNGLIMQSVIIDTAIYKISDEKRAIGIQVKATNHSRISPFLETTLSLFMLENNELICVLDKYPVGEYNGEWDDRCAGQFTDAKTVLIMSDKKSNGYYDIITQRTYRTTTSYLIDEECDYEEHISHATKTIHFVDGWYKWE